MNLPFGTSTSFDSYVASVSETALLSCLFPKQVRVKFLTLTLALGPAEYKRQRKSLLFLGLGNSYQFSTPTRLPGSVDPSPRSFLRSWLPLPPEARFHSILPSPLASRWALWGRPRSREPGSFLTPTASGQVPGTPPAPRGAGGLSWLLHRRNPQVPPSLVSFSGDAARSLRSCPKHHTLLLQSQVHRR